MNLWSGRERRAPWHSIGCLALVAATSILLSCDDDAGPTVVWIAVPSGWTVARNLYELPLGEGEVSAETRRLDFEVVPPERDRGTGRVRGYALYYVCEGASGECVYRRQDFRVEIPLPEERGPR